MDADGAPHKRAMGDVETVAKVIFANRRHHEPVHSWNDLYSDEQAAYRAMALAAIDSLGLTEEICSYEDTEVKSVSGGEGVMRYGGQTVTSLGWRTDRRLVSPWAKVARSD